MLRLPGLLMAATVLAASAAATPVMWTIGGDLFGVPRNLVQVDAGTQTVGTPIVLGDGSTGFAGGLASSGGGFYGIQWDGFSSAYLVQISLSGNVTTLFSAGQYSYGGLVMEGNQLYGIRADSSGVADLVVFDLLAQTVTSVGVNGLPVGLLGGLAGGPSAGKLYSLHNDGFGASTLYEIDLAAKTAIPMAISLGSGFTGGLAFDGSLFYALASDVNAGSTLYSFGLSDPAPTVRFAVGTGYLNAALTVGSETAIPEPGTMMLTVAGAMLLAIARRTR